MATKKEQLKLRPILHILIVGFHHQKGSTIEYSHPPLVVPSARANAEEESLTTSVGDSSWRHLPHLALPDGCHNYQEESVYFTLPDLSDPTKSVYGVACCRQIDVKDLPRIEKDVTRSTVQKSICVMSLYPVFGFIEAKLSLVTHAYFNTKDFSDVGILHEIYNNLNTALTNSCQLAPIFHIGLSQRDLVACYHHRLLQIYKAILLQRKVLLYGAPTLRVCNSILSIISLFHYSLEDLVNKENSQNECFLPLSIFSKVQSFQPYLCLQQMESLKLSTTCVLAGVVNPLFEKRHSDLCDVFVDMASGHIIINNQSLTAPLHLSAADLRFCSLLSEAVSESSNESSSHSDWLGSNEWVLAQYKLFLLSLLKTSLLGDDTARGEFNADFMASWTESDAYTSWLEMYSMQSKVTTIEPKSKSDKVDLFESISPTHVCTGEMSVSDVKRRLVAQASDYGLDVQTREGMVHQTQQVIAQTTDRVTSVVGQAWSSASSAVYSWWGGDEEISNDNSV